MSCLFDSLSYFVKENSFQIRNIICDYLEANNIIIEGLDTNFILSLDMPKDNYISNMRMPSSPIEVAKRRPLLTETIPCAKARFLVLAIF